MFTGLIEDIGRLAGTSSGGDRLRVTVECNLDLTRVKLGDSIAVDGACFTVVEKQARAFVFEASPESLARTTLASKPVGARVHLERALRLGARLDGHLVQGHVDGVGVVLRSELVGNAWRVQVAPPPSVGRLLVPKGSVAVNGVSLTLNEVDDDGARFEVMVVPYSAQKTLLASLASGERVNLEADILGKYVLWFMKRGELSAKPALDGLLSEGDGELDDDGAEGGGEGYAPREGDEGGRGGGVDLAFLRRHGFA